MILDNRYQILTTLGSGSFSETYIAKDTQMPSGRLSVVKKFKPSTFHQQSYALALEAFQKQASTLEMLRFDQIPQLYDYFAWQDNFYLIQERIEGQTLGGKIRDRGPLTEAETHQFLVHFLPVLSYLHSHQVIHQTLTPDHIILRQQDGKPVAIGFGAMQQPQSIRETDDSDAIALYSEDFVPPEQRQGDPLTPASDLYALGMTAIYALTGILPQDMDHDRQSGQVIWRGCAPGVSERLADVLDQAIQMNPDDRFSSADNMMAALADEHSLAPTVFSEAGTGVNPFAAIPKRRRRRSIVSLLAGMAMVLTTGAAGAYVYAQSQKQAKPHTIEQISTLYQQGKFADCQEAVQQLTAGAKAKAKIQSLLNQCRLGEAEQLATKGDYRAAIAQAKTIPLKASNHDQRQQSIVAWSRELPAQEKLERAQELVDKGQPQDAIKTLMQVEQGTQTAPQAWQTIADLTHVPLFNNTMAKEPYLQTQQNRNRVVSVTTKFGTAQVDRDWEQWPQYQLPTAQERSTDPSWDDPWQESYAIVANKMTLGFIYGCKEKNLLQTEVAFDRSLALGLMQTQLHQMLGGKADKNLQDKLAQIHQGEVSQHRFNTGRIKGVIHSKGPSSDGQIILEVRKV